MIVNATCFFIDQDRVRLASASLAVLLAWLQNATISTLQARQELDIMHPAARIQELRDQGHNIVTHWATVDIGKAKHRVACYSLLSDV